MKIFSANQIQKADQFTIEHGIISSINLMEKAAQQCVNWILKHFSNNEQFCIFCGNGNNGGDGFAIARLLYLKGYHVEVFIDSSKKDFAQDAQINFNRLKELSGIDIHDFDEFDSKIYKNYIIIDALFGIGLNRIIEGKAAEIIAALNQIDAFKIAIDVPSGIFVDEIHHENSIIFDANITLSFQFWKKAFLHPETGKFCGKIVILDIELSKQYIDNEDASDFVIDEKLILENFKPRNEFSHKGNFGKVCIVGGSFGKMGAAVLAVKSALRTGSGLTFAIAPKCGYEILQTTCPEAIFLYGGKDFVKNFEINLDFTYGIGPGLGLDYETEEQFLEFLQTYHKPLVLDADALNMISKNNANLKLISKKSIITPHPKEFERLFGKTENSFERLRLAIQKSIEFDIFIVLKDHHTQIITPEKEVYYNITGNSGLAKGGSGDVLLGIITALLSQGYSPKNAAIFGVWLHGKSADFAAKKIAKESMTATDVIENISEVFRSLNSKAKNF